MIIIKIIIKWPHNNRMTSYFHNNLLHILTHKNFLCIYSTIISPQGEKCIKYYYYIICYFSNIFNCMLLWLNTLNVVLNFHLSTYTMLLINSLHRDLMLTVLWYKVCLKLNKLASLFPLPKQQCPIGRSKVKLVGPDF